MLAVYNIDRKRDKNKEAIKMKKADVEKKMTAIKEAVEKRYRFYSFGDSMFIHG